MIKSPAKASIETLQIVMSDSPVAELSTGTNLGPYQIIERIGAGGMGEVYLAEDTRLGRKVALKVLPAGLTGDRERVQRFQQEARAASALNHPNIITIYDIGQSGVHHFIASEFIAGETLRRRLAKAKLKIGEALEIITQAASAICAAHEAGIIHRDVKPENIMLREDRIVKVLDFGLAKLSERTAIQPESPTLVETAPGLVLGTAFYMSPEQARGLVVDARTDIWSLGVVLYEIIAGHVPFHGATGSDVIAAILERQPMTLVRYLPDLPAELEWIVTKALRKDREERYQTTREFLTDVNALKRKLEFEDELERSFGAERRLDHARGSRAASAAAQHDPTHKRLQAPTDSIAILPFANNTNDPNLDYFSDGITENIINSLSRLAKLRVMAWSTVSRYRSQQTDPRDAGRELGVRAVLTGRILNVGDRFAIRTEIVDAGDGSHLFGESYICEPDKILEVEAEIAHKISEQLLIRLSTNERQQLYHRYTDNVEAYHAYLRGRYCWNKRTDEGVRKAIDYFRQAIDQDPSYALAYAGLADSYLVLGAFGIATLPPNEAFPRAREAAIRALAIDETLGESHAVLAYVLGNFEWNWPAAETEFKRALELTPNYATAHHWYGFVYLTAQGELNAAMAEAKRALELDPLSLAVSSNLGLLLYLARRYDEAIVQLKKTLEMDAQFVYSHWELALVYEQKGMYDEAIAELQRAMLFSKNNMLPLALLGHTYAVAGKRTEALGVLEQLTDPQQQRYLSAYRIAAIYAALDQKDEAFRWLDKAVAERDGWLGWLRLDPVMDRLRQDARFKKLLAQIGLDQTSSDVSEQPTRVMDVVISEPTPAIVMSSQARAGRRAGRVPLALGLIAIFSAFGYLWFRSDPNKLAASSLKNLSFNQLTFESGPEFFPSLSPDGKSVVYASRSSGNWDIYLQRVGGSNAINLTSNSLADDSQPVFSPDGRRIAFRSDREGGGIFLMGATGESIIRLSDFGYSPSWSPDGTRIVVGTEKIPQPSTRPTRSQLWSIDINGGGRRLLSEGDCLQPVYSPNHQRIAYWSRPSRIGQREEIWTIPAAGGEAVAVTNGTSTDLNPVWSPDGNHLYFSSNRGGSMNVWRVAIDEKSGKPLAEPEAVTAIGASASVLQLSFAKDGRRLAYSAQEETRNLRKVDFNPTTGQIVGQPASITRGAMQLWFPAPSPDGQWLACYSMGQQGHIFLLKTDGSELKDLTNDDHRHFWPRWSPDGRRLAFSSRRTGNFELWQINRDGSGLRQLTDGHQSPGAHYSVWSPDGTRIAYSVHAPKNECRIFQSDKAWEEQSPEAITPLSDPNIAFEAWSWSRDGKYLAGIKHLPNGVHSGIGIYDLEKKTYDWLTDFGDWPWWLADSRRILFVSQGSLFLFDTQSKKYHPILTVTNEDVDIGGPSLSHDNKTIFFSFVDTQADIWLMDFRQE